MTISKKILKLFAVMLIVSSWYCSVSAQSESDYALLQIPFFSDPFIWNLNKTVTNGYLEVDLFGKPRASAQSYVYHPVDGLKSGMSFQIDRDWDRLVYWEGLDYWLRAYGSHGSSGCQFWSPSSIEAFAPGNDQVIPNYYSVFVGDTENNRIVRLDYRWDLEVWTCLQPAISGYGLTRPRDFDHNNDFYFYPDDTDYLWVISGQNVVQRWMCNGTHMATHDNPGCDGDPGTWCRLTAVASGRSINTPEPYANTDALYIADGGNQRIEWYFKWSGAEPLFLMGEVATDAHIVDLEVDNFGQLWALDGNTGIVTKYTDNLFPLCTYGNTGSHNRFFNPVNISNAGGYLASGVVVITEAWTDTSGFLRFVIGTDIVDFSITATRANNWLYVNYVLVDPSNVTVKIFDSQGGLVKTLFDGLQMSGACVSVWNGTNSSGQPVPDGSYRAEVVSTCSYISSATGQPANVVVKEEWFTHPCCNIRGNVDDIGGIDISDLVALVDYMFTDGLNPPCLAQANVNGSGGDTAGDIDIADLVALVDYMFTGGPLPPPC